MTYIIVALALFFLAAAIVFIPYCLFRVMIREVNRSDDWDN